MSARFRAIFAAVLIVSLGAVLPAQATFVAKKTLYERLGGKPAIDAVVDDLVARILRNPKINFFFFRKTSVPKLKRLLKEQICQATGGPCVYTGRSMKESHREYRIKASHFNAMGADLDRTLRKFKVPSRERNELLRLLGTMQNDIVTVR